MTNEEAIKRLKEVQIEFNENWVDYSGINEAFEKGPQGDIRWTDKIFVKSNGDIIDFEGRVVGHIDLEVMKGGADIRGDNK